MFCGLCSYRDESSKQIHDPASRGRILRQNIAADFHSRVFEQILEEDCSEKDRNEKDKKEKAAPGGTARQIVFFVELPGLEPRPTEPESVVLPLHYSSVTKSFSF